MGLICLVYNYTDSEIVWLIIKEAPDSWSSLLQSNLCKLVMQFQNAVKYHEATLLAMHQPQPNKVTQFHNRAFQSQRFCPRKAQANMVGLGFRTGNPRVGFSHTVPIPANTLPMAGTTLTQPVNCVVSDETCGIHDTRGYFALKYCKYIMKYIKISK